MDLILKIYITFLNSSTVILEFFCSPKLVFSRINHDTMLTMLLIIFCLACKPKLNVQQHCPAITNGIRKCRKTNKNIWEKLQFRSICSRQITPDTKFQRCASSKRLMHTTLTSVQSSLSSWACTGVLKRQQPALATVTSPDWLISNILISSEPLILQNTFQVD